MLWDVSQDGVRDIIVARNSNFVSIFVSDGEGRYQPRMDVAGSSAPSGIALADFDRNGHIDIVTMNDAEEGGFSVMLGRGSITMERPGAHFHSGAFGIQRMSSQTTLT